MTTISDIQMRCLLDTSRYFVWISVTTITICFVFLCGCCWCQYHQHGKILIQYRAARRRASFPTAVGGTMGFKLGNIRIRKIGLRLRKWRYGNIFMPFSEIINSIVRRHCCYMLVCVVAYVFCRFLSSLSVSNFTDDLSTLQTLRLFWQN